MNRLSFNKVLDRYLVEGKMSASDYEMLDEFQLEVVQCVKRAMKRLNKSKETKTY